MEHCGNTEEGEAAWKSFTKVVFFSRSSEKFLPGGDSVRNFPGRGNRTSQRALKARNMMRKEQMIWFGCSTAKTRSFRAFRS